MSSTLVRVPPSMTLPPQTLSLSSRKNILMSRFTSLCSNEKLWLISPKVHKIRQENLSERESVIRRTYFANQSSYQLRSSSFVLWPHYWNWARLQILFLHRKRLFLNFPSVAGQWCVRECDLGLDIEVSSKLSARGAPGPISQSEAGTGPR